MLKIYLCMLMVTCFFNTKSMFFNIVGLSHDYRGLIARLSWAYRTIVVDLSHDFLVIISLQINLMILTKSSWFA